ncbi:MAG: extracellular solute-binding protein [Oscillospiraceae bacterium]|jgi:ABC-type glycerol-3-phosphate transport system substrate-binding protein|nr:extracellular solute-binding protein [Oscillospiraceae bacterium]
MKTSRTFIKFLSLLLAVALIMSLAACGTQGTQSPPSDSPIATAPSEPPKNNAKYTADGKRIITIGTWYDKYYVSKHTDIYDDPSVVESDGTEAGDKQILIAETRLARIREIEQKYNVVLEYVNLTFEGIQESISTSIPEGAPDVDIYEVDTQFGIPAVINGYGISLEDMGLEGTDVLGEQTAMKYLQLMGQDESYLFNPSVTGATNAYVLAFNMDLINKAGLENPQDLYDRGEWTWDVWRDYLKKLTIDTDGDGAPNIYGYSGYWTYLLTNLMFANGTGIATGETETISSAATVEVLQFIDKIYNTDKTARPWDASNWEINNRLYAEGLSGFWIGADWIFQENGAGELPFEIGVVPWPTGPHGDDATNKLSPPDGTWYFIPQGTEDPRLVYDVMFDWVDWYGGDKSLGEDNDWSRKLYMNDRNFDYATMMASRPGFDLWESLGKTTAFSIMFMLSGQMTADEVVERYKEPYQAAIDEFFGKEPRPTPTVESAEEPAA